MRVSALAPGLWHWTALHPDWTAGEGWGQEVGCVYYEGPDAVVLVDPLIPPEAPDEFLHHLDLDVQRNGLPVAVVVTVHWHERSARELAGRYGVEVRSRDDLPGGVVAYDAHCHDEVLLWLPEHAALIAGDVLLGDPDGIRMCPDSWLPEGTEPAALREQLRPLLDLPVERILVSHGEPVLADAPAALARALA